MVSDQKPQVEKFIDAAREIGADDDAARFDERLAKIVKHKPVEKPEDSTLAEKDSSP